MELGIGLIVLIVAVVWYFGSSMNNAADVINEGLEASADMASVKLKRMKHEQKMNMVKAYAEDSVDEKLLETATKNKALIDAMKF